MSPEDWEDLFLDLGVIVGWAFILGHLLLACSTTAL